MAFHVVFLIVLVFVLELHRRYLNLTQRIESSLDIWVTVFILEKKKKYEEAKLNVTLVTFLYIPLQILFTF